MALLRNMTLFCLRQKLAVWLRLAWSSQFCLCLPSVGMCHYASLGGVTFIKKVVGNYSQYRGVQAQASADPVTLVSLALQRLSDQFQRWALMCSVSMS